jgi:hypothetical protein
MQSPLYDDRQQAYRDSRREETAQQQLSRQRRLLDRDGPIAASTGRFNLKHDWSGDDAANPLKMFGEARCAPSPRRSGARAEG